MENWIYWVAKQGLMRKSDLRPKKGKMRIENRVEG